MSSQGRYSILIEAQTGNAEAAIARLKGSLASLNTVGQPVGQVQGSLDRLSTSANTAQMSVQKLVGISGPLSSNFSNAATRAGQLSGALGNMNVNAKGVVGGLSQTNTLAGNTAGSMGKLATETEKASKSTLGMASNLRGMIIPIVGMGSAIIEAVGMFQAFQDVSRNVEEAQKKVNEAIKRYGQDSKEARDATAQLEQAQRGLQFILRNTIQSFSDIGIFAALMANSLLKLRTNATSLTPALNAATTANGALGTSMVATGAATNAAGGILTRFTGILRAIPAALGPIGIILTAVGAAVAAFTALYSQNIGGIRDSTNDFGAAVGELIPILRPFGDLLMGIGGQLGITGESAERTAQHFRNATTGFQEMGTLWEQTARNISQAFMEWGAAVQEGAALVGDSISDLFTGIGNQVGQWLSEFGARVQSGFQNTFGGLVDLATQIAQDIGSALSGVGQWIVGAGISTLEALGIDGGALISEAEKIAQQIAAAFSGLRQTINETVKGAFNQVPGAGGNVPGTAGQFESEFSKQQREAAERAQRETFMKPIEMPSGFTRGGRLASDMGLIKGATQTVEDLGIAQENIFRQPTGKTGLSQLSSPQTLQGVRNLSAEINNLALVEQKQAAIDKIITDQLKDQQTATTQANAAWEMLTTNHDIATIASLDMKDASDLLNQEIDVGDSALRRLQDAQKAVIEGKKEGKNATQIEADVQRALNGEMEHGVKIAEEQKTVIGELRNANEEAAATLLQTGKAAMDGSLAYQMQAKGAIEAGQAIMDYGSNLVAATEFNRVYGENVRKAAFQQVAFQTGVEKQKAALNDSIVALHENAGALAEYSRQLATGEPQQLAFARGIQTQQKAMMDSIVAVNESAGALEEYGRQLETGIPQAVAFAQGQQEVAKSLMDLTVEGAEAAGAVQALWKEFTTGEHAVAQLAKGFLEGKRAALEWGNGIQEANGQIVGFISGLEDMAQRIGIALPESFRLSREQLQQEIGLMRGDLESLATLGETMEGLGDAIRESLVVGLEDLDDDLEEKLDEAKDVFEEKLGVEMPESVERALEQAGIDESLASAGEFALQNFVATMSDPQAFNEMGQSWIESINNVFDQLSPEMQAKATELIQNINAVIADPSNTQAWSRLISNAEALGISLDALGPTLDRLKQQGGAAAAALVEFASSIDLSGPVAQFTKDVDQMIQDLSRLSTATQAPGVSPQFKTIMGQEQAFKELESQLEAGQITPEQFQQLGAQLTGGGAGAADLSGIQTVLTDVETRLANLPVLAQQAAAGIVSALSGVISQLTLLGQQVGLVGETFTILGSMATQMDATIQTAISNTISQLTLLGQQVGLVGETFTLLGGIANEMAATVAGAISSVISQLTLLGQSVGLVGQAFTALGGIATQTAGVVNSATNIMITALQGVQNMATQTGTVILTIGTQAQSAAQTVNAATNTMITALQGVQNQAQITAQSFAQIGDAANQAAGVVESAAGRMVSALQSAADAAAQVAEAIRAIGQAAQEAESSVNSLSQAIQNIPDRTVTITVQYRTVGSPPPGTSLGGGFGGQFGGGGGGGTPSITGGGGGGGPGEPTLQFGAQGGLGRPAFDHKSKEFNDLGILAPVLVDHPTRLLVGESGPELVSVTPVNRYRHGKSGEISSFRRSVSEFQAPAPELHFQSYNLETITI